MDLLRMPPIASTPTWESTQTACPSQTRPDRLCQRHNNEQHVISQSNQQEARQNHLASHFKFNSFLNSAWPNIHAHIAGPGISSISDRPFPRTPFALLITPWYPRHT
jgi:hypothetical protein